MKAFALAMVAMIAITIVAVLALQTVSMSSKDTYIVKANVRD